MEVATGLENINQGILHHLKEVCSKTSRFSAATKLGISVAVVEHICSLDSFQVRKTAEDYAKQGLVITFSNFMGERPLDARGLAIDSFFKNSVNG
jgi:hypothetical protein